MDDRDPRMIAPVHQCTNASIHLHDNAAMLRRVGVGFRVRVRVRERDRVRVRATHHRPECAEQHILPLAHVQQLRGGVELISVRVRCRGRGSTQSS